MLFGKQLVTGEEMILFTHIPKTGGSSLRHSVATMVGTTPREAKGKLWKPKKSDPNKSMPDTRLIAGHFKYGRHKYFNRKPLYITVVRDPVKRFFSWYHYIQRLPNHPKHSFIGGRSMEEALAIAIEKEYPGTHDDQCKRLSLERSFQAAQAAVDRNYFLAATTEQLAEINEAMWRAYAPGSDVPELQRRKARPAHAPDVLSPELKRMLEKTSPNDFLLTEYVKKQFADLMLEALPILRSSGYRALITGSTEGSAATQSVAAE